MDGGVAGEGDGHRWGFAVSASRDMANAVREFTKRAQSVDGVARPVYGTVLDTSPWRVELHGSSTVLDEEALVTASSAKGVQPGDSAVLLPMADGDFVLLATLSGGGAAAVGAAGVDELGDAVDALTEAVDALTAAVAAFSDGLVLAERSAPAAPAAGEAILYARDGGGKTELCVRFHTGAVQVVATEP